MNNKIIALIFIIGIFALATIAVLLFLSPGNNNAPSQNPTAIPSPKKELEFVVVRVLPSGFSPPEVTIKKGMILRFTNPLEEKVNISWGERQHTSEPVFRGNDIATTVFDTEGVYPFSDDLNPPHSGKVVVR